MSLPRFYAPDLTSIDNPPSSGLLVLCETESHHLRNVLRLKEREFIEVFDGQGHRATGVIESVGRNAAHVSIDRLTLKLQNRHATELVIATAVPKGDRFDWLIEKSCELGVDQLIPLKTERGTVDPRLSKLDRLRQAVVAACKQCQRDWLMTIGAFSSLDEVLSAHPDGIFLLAEPSGNSLTSLAPSLVRSKRVIVLIGPEGGFTDREQEKVLARGGLPVTCGEHILRIETAALSTAALLRTLMATASCDGHQV